MSAGAAQAGRDDAVLEKRRELKRRALAAAILAPVALGVAWLGGPLFIILLVAAAVIVFLEWRRIVGETRWTLRSYLPIATLVATAFVLPNAGAAWAFLTLLAGAAISAAIGVARGRGPWLALGAVYAGLLFLGLGVVRGEGASGAAAIFWLLLVVWAADTSAYFVGRRVGGPKLWPRVSPSKTWSGALGGLGGAIVVGIFFWALDLAGPLVPFVALTAVVAIASMAGDLLESAVKRRFKVKDASRLIPGHGGLMDRVDSLVAAGLLCAVLGLARGGESVAQALLRW